jgi:hypothetical protein
MFRAVLSVTFVCAMASVALGKDLCIQLNTVYFPGAQLVLKKVKLGPRNVAPLQGYLAYSSRPSAFDSFYPLYGGSVVDSGGVVAFAMSVHRVFVGPGFGTGGDMSATYAISLRCQPGPDGKVNLLDQCSANVNSVDTTALVVACKDGVAIP